MTPKLSESDAYTELLKFIEANTTWERYGYYGPLIYTGPLLEKLTKIAADRGVTLEGCVPDDS